MESVRQPGSTRLRSLYRILSGPGAVLDIRSTRLEISAGPTVRISHSAHSSSTGFTSIRGDPSAVGPPLEEDLRWFVIVLSSSGQAGDLPFSMWFMALRLLVRYSFWIRAASRGSYTGLVGLGCRCRFGCGPDRDGPFWGAFGVFSPWPSVAKRMKASRNASRPSKSSSAIRSSSALHFCCWTLPLVGSGRGSSAESRCLTSMSSCLVSGTFVGKGLVHSVGFGGEFCPSFRGAFWFSSWSGGCSGEGWSGC